MDEQAFFEFVAHRDGIDAAEDTMLSGIDQSDFIYPLPLDDSVERNVDNSPVIEAIVGIRSMFASMDRISDTLKTFDDASVVYKESHNRAIAEIAEMNTDMENMERLLDTVFTVIKESVARASPSTTPASSLRPVEEEGPTLKRRRTSEQCDSYNMTTEDYYNVFECLRAE